MLLAARRAYSVCTCSEAAKQEEKINQWAIIFLPRKFITRHVAGYALPGVMMKIHLGKKEVTPWVTASVLDAEGRMRFVQALPSCFKLFGWGDLSWGNKMTNEHESYFSTDWRLEKIRLLACMGLQHSPLRLHHRKLVRCPLLCRRIGHTWDIGQFWHPSTLKWPVSPMENL